MAFEPFARLKAKGYEVIEYSHPQTMSKRVHVRKGDLEYTHQIHWSEDNNPKVYGAIETHIERQFESVARKKIEDMAIMHGVSNIGPKHVPYDYYESYMKQCAREGQMPDPMIRPMYSTKDPELTNPTITKKDTKPKPNKILLIINKRK